MHPQKIKYIAFFDTQDSIIKRNFVSSASNKVEYIAKTIASLGINVKIISMSQVLETAFKIYPSERKKIADNVDLVLPFSWGGNNIFLKKLKVFWHLVNIFLYLICNCGKSDTIIVYHSLGYFDAIRWAKKIRKFRLILEVEEIYSDVSKMSSYWRKLEFKMFDIADAFILSNDLLNKKINKKNKPSIVIYGAYKIETQRIDKFNDGKIHVIYAGTFDPNKGGAQAAISAVEYLPANYHMHICGFGNDSTVKQIITQINIVQAKSKATITYDGLKKGDDFIEFLQKCHIGLSTQIPEGEYNNTSFPSKVLTYLANGLAVVSIQIPVLLETEFSNNISYYEKYDGESLAKAIINCSFSLSYRRTIEKLDEKFKSNIKSILSY